MPHKTETPLPLSQQLLTWIPRAMGLLDWVGTPESTVKKARRGERVPDAWDDLIDECVFALGLEPDAGQLAGLRANLRALDLKFAALDPLGLSVEDRLIPALHLLLPLVGARLGTLAAMVDEGIWEMPTADGAPLPIADWLCEPLHPETSWRAAQAMLRLHRPDWSPWNADARALEDEKGVLRKTTQRWRDGSVERPNPKKLRAVCEALTDDPAQQRRARLILGAGRLSVVLRQSMAGWLGAERAADVARVASRWARASRAALSQPASRAGLADFFVEVLESEHGAAYFASREPTFRGMLGAETPAGAAGVLRVRAAIARAGDGAALRWILLEQLMWPNAMIAALGPQLGAPDIGEVMLFRDAAEYLQETWWTAALLREAPTICPGPEHAALRNDAEALLTHLRQVISPADQREAMQVVGLRLGAALFHALDDPALPGSLADLFASAERRRFAPSMVEPQVDDEDLVHLPHLMAFRARRLAEAGDEAGAIRWMAGWRDSDHPRGWHEREAAAAAALCLGHRAIDRARRCRGVLAGPSTLDALYASEGLPAPKVLIAVGALTAARAAEVAGDLSRARGDALDVIASAERIGGAMLIAALSCLTPPATDAVRARSVARLLSLAIRVEALSGTSPSEWERSQLIAEDLQRSVEGGIEQPAVWAAMAVWLELTGAPRRRQQHAHKQAEHLGAGAERDAIRARLVDDGLLAAPEEA